MNGALLYLPYLPNVFWFSNYLKHSPVIIEREEKFIKSSYRNRCVIAGANGLQILSIPIEGGRDHAQLYKEVLIANTYHWQKKHWQSIRSCYGSAPYFEHYACKILPLFETRFEFLFEFNLAILSTLLASLKINDTFSLTTIFEKHNTTQFDLRFVKGAEEKPVAPSYYQVFENKNGFMANLSILDAVFNLGPSTKDYLLTIHS